MVKTDPKIEPPIQSHADRPIPRTALPFRLDEYPNGQKHISYFLGQSHYQMTADGPIGVNLLKMMQLFRDLENERNGWLAERDELVTRVTMAESDLKTAQHKAAEWENKYHNLKDGTKNIGGRPRKED